ncbi:MAG: cell wall hydrolase [Clostridia bacterium]|nr:cell wall hydrolase [Clostridia bacterium]
MTKKLAELSGSVSVLSASLILVLAILISPTHLPEIRVPKVHRMPVDAAVPLEPASPDQGVSKTAPIPAETELSAELNEIYGVASGSMSNTVFGLSENAARRNKDLISSVLAVSQSVENFPVTVSVTPEEYQLLLYCVGHETRSGSLPHKILITEVIFNRVQGPRFGSSVRDVILAPGQFDVMVGYQGWGNWTPDPTTVEAVNLVLSGSAPNYSEGAVYFCNPYIVGEGNWFDMSLQAVCEIEGHRFYK